MIDLRGLSRGSKTAAVVILVVLLQVIVMAVLGLSAISGDRAEGARLAREEARARARDRAVGIGEQAHEGLLGAMREAARIALNAGGLRNPPRDLWYRAVREFYRVDADGRVRSAGGTLLYVPPDVVAAAEQREDRTLLDRMERSLASWQGPEPAAIEARRQYVQTFPYRTDDAGYARAVGEALRLAVDVAASSSSPVSLSDAVLLAYETAAVNDRRPAAAQPGFEYVRARLGRLVAEPGREALAAGLADLDRARAGLAEFLEFALPLAKDAAAYPAPARLFPLRGSAEIVALAPIARTASTTASECLLARLDRRTIALLLESLSVPAPGSASPSAVRLVQREAPVEPGDAVRVPLQRADFDPALDVVVPVGAAVPAAAATGPRETFYWFILGLAALGVSTAGFVLVRVLRREVHLARLKADFVSNLSHELKTPLTSIGLFTEMLREDRLAGDERREAVDVIAQESERLQRIVGRMIDVARREAGPTAYALAAGDLDAAVRAACDRFRRLERDPGLDLQTDLAGDLPPVLLDADAIDDAVTNLLSNAWKYRRGDRARIRVSTARAGRRVELVVADDGIGIPRRERRRVFEMFYRAENYLSRSVPGTGLGLALVRTIVRAHRGRIRIEGAPGVGTTFRLRFPVARGARAASPSGAPPAPVPSGPSPRALAGDRG